MKQVPQRGPTDIKRYRSIVSRTWRPGARSLCTPDTDTRETDIVQETKQNKARNEMKAEMLYLRRTDEIDQWESEKTNETSVY